VYLYTVDDLNSVIDENKQTRQSAAQQAEQIVDHEVNLYMNRLRSLAAKDTIRDYREQVEDLQSAILEKSRKQLLAGKDPEAVLEQLAHTFGNKLMHMPTKKMKEAAADGDNTLLDAARRLFDLDSSEK